MNMLPSKSVCLYTARYASSGKNKQKKTFFNPSADWPDISSASERQQCEAANQILPHNYNRHTVHLFLPTEILQYLGYFKRIQHKAPLTNTIHQEQPLYKSGHDLPQHLPTTPIITGVNVMRAGF